MSSSVQGNFVDQTWAASLPAFFKDNVKPSVAGESFLIPRQNDTIPDIVTKNTVGTVYNRGFIDRPVNRLETTRSFILNPSSYNARLHPHDVTSGTGGIDNLSNLYRFGHPLPFSDAEDFADLQFFAKYQNDKGLDPLTEGYAVKAIGEGGSMLASAMAKDRALLNEKMLMQKMHNEAVKEEIKYRQQVGEETTLTRANLQQFLEQSAQDARDLTRGDGEDENYEDEGGNDGQGVEGPMSESDSFAAPAFTESGTPAALMGAPATEAPATEEDENTAPEDDVPTTRISLNQARAKNYRIFLGATQVGAANRYVYYIIAAPRQTSRVTWMFVSQRSYPTEDSATRGIERFGTQFLNPSESANVAQMFGVEAINFQLMAMNEEDVNTIIKSEPGRSHTSDSSVQSFYNLIATNPERAPSISVSSVASSLTNPSFRGPAQFPNNTLDSIARQIYQQTAAPSDPSSSSSSSSSDSSLISDVKSSIRSQLAAESQNAGVSNSSYWDAQMRNTQDVKELLHLMGARSSNPAAVFSNAYSATPYFVRRTQMGLDGNYSKRQAMVGPRRAAAFEPRVEQATSQGGDVFGTAEKASDPRMALFHGRRPGASTYLDPNLAAETGSFKQLEYHAGNNRYDGNIDGPSEQASLAIRNPTHARNMQGGVSRDFVRPTPDNRQTAGVLGKNQRTPSANITIANRTSTNPVAAFRGGAAPLR